MKNINELLNYLNNASKGAYQISGFLEYIDLDSRLDIIKRAKLYHKKARRLCKDGLQHDVVKIFAFIDKDRNLRNVGIKARTLTTLEQWIRIFIADYHNLTLEQAKEFVLK